MTHSAEISALVPTLNENLPQKPGFCYSLTNTIMFFLSLTDAYTALPEPPNSQIQGKETGRWCDNLANFRQQKKSSILPDSL